MKLPYRIFDEGAKADIPYRRYKTLDKAIDRCLSLLWRLKVGNTFTVYSLRDYKGIIQFTRKVDAIQVLSDPSLQYRDYLPDLGSLHSRRRSARPGSNGSGQRHSESP